MFHTIRDIPNNMSETPKIREVAPKSERDTNQSYRGHSERGHLSIREGILINQRDRHERSPRWTPNDQREGVHRTRTERDTTNDKEKNKRAADLE